jgi:peroxiredoxin
MTASVEQAIADARTESGQSLAEHSAQSPLLLGFLRHSGCPYCRQTLSDLGRLRAKLESSHTRLVIVHQDTPERGAAWIGSYGLGDCQQISDPENQLYERFGLGKASWWDLVGPHTWWPGFKATLLEMHGVGKVVGDIKQLTGAFLIRDGKVVKAFRQRYSSDRPDYTSMVCDL